MFNKERFLYLFLCLTCAFCSLTAIAYAQLTENMSVEGKISVLNNGGLLINNFAGLVGSIEGQTKETQLIIQSGFIAGNGTASHTVAFPVSFSTAPFVTVTPFDGADVYNNSLRFNVDDVTVSSFLIKTAGNVAVDNGFYWIAIGPK